MPTSSEVFFQQSLPHVTGSGPSNTLGSASFYRQSDSVEIFIPESAIINMPIKVGSTVRRHLRNSAAVAGRNILSVAIPTAVREALRRAVFAKITEGAASTALGSIAGFFPCVLQIAGLYWDAHLHTQTRYTIVGRVCCIILAGSTVTTLIAVGVMTSPAVSAALAGANFVYTPMRDLIQHYVRRTDNLSANLSKKGAAIGAAAYIPNQFLVNEGMQHSSDLLANYMDSVLANSIARAGMNFLGECIDDSVTLGVQSSIQKKDLEAKLSLSPPQNHTWRDVTNRILNVHAGRSSLFSTVFSTAFLTHHFAAKEASRVASPITTASSITSTASKGAGASTDHVGLALESLGVGLAAGMGYLPFIFAAGQTDPRREYDVESAFVENDFPSASPNRNPEFRVENETTRRS